MVTKLWPGGAGGGWGWGWELCHLCDPIFGPTVPCSPGQQESKPIGVKRSLSVDLNDLWIGTHVCCANWKIAPINPSKWKREICPPGTRRSRSVGDLYLGMKAGPRLLVSDVLHNKRGAGIVKARQETLWLQTRRHSSGPGPGEQNSLCFVAVISVAARIKLEPTWEDATLFSREWEWKESGCREMFAVFVQFVKVIGKQSSVSQWLWHSFQPVLWACQQCCSLFHSV